ncbi:MAG: hypothetical protein A2Y45_07370 [Tenericutes bacterium GWC2_34_14]|nr:MAG: hypothetical protein A2Z84_06790 [Tenericutes bacterium GWA2_35_7]OHE29727.1 MAG: hypothetical protein A2Y45_07370 [Tenericutes bacterium GWC2_34_14]OHE34706.1 MAG: hypothetical protein A2012_00980 [Tenericutes bacterium GWE2_34_108]OHE37433.1 MAG: hypothetical protein A2Y46_02030 [Tenericutes bacterium GWF1_35_14]OHE39432.1 MAG: hypothetical protein A2Y44_00830 [Tenericutes bacterium GWF2_35_184]OHE44378.1 MAG: hypothetical protein A2221_04680 [Tenericutes bacterium RIFOXYA2_FULL_36_3
MTEIILQAYIVLDELKQDPMFTEMKALDLYIMNTYQEEIKVFQNAKHIYDDVMATGGTYHPDFKKAVKDFSEAKATLYAKPEVSRYFQLEKSFQDDINAYLKTMTDTVSTHIKTPNKLGIVQKGGSCHVR